MKKVITLIFLSGLFLVSCSKEEVTKETTNTDIYPPVYLKIQAVDNDGTVTESNIYKS